MERKRLKSTLETVTNVAVLLVAIAALSTFAINHFLKTSSPKLVPGLQRGAILPPIPKVDYHSNKHTLLIALNTDCSFCRDSLPFYRKLLEATHQSKKDLHVVALFPNKIEQVAAYVKDNDLKFDAIGEVRFEPLLLSGTPSLILVNNNGEVNDFWIGKLGDAEANELIHSLTLEELD